MQRINSGGRAFTIYASPRRHPVLFVTALPAEVGTGGGDGDDVGGVSRVPSQLGREDGSFFVNAVLLERVRGRARKRCK